MSLGKLKKQVEKYEAMLPERERDGPKKTFIITDSKGSYLNRFLRRRDYIQIVWKSGARVGELDLLSRLQNKLKDTEQPIVLIWLGTCDFTKKNRNRGISLRRVCADDVMAECAVMRDTILGFNNSAQIFLLHCPIYSIYKWNASKGCNDLSDESQDSTLKQTICTFNKAVDDFNSIYTPKFSLDLIFPISINVIIPVKRGTHLNFKQ